MGSGIAQVCAQKQHQTFIFDIGTNVLNASKNNLEKIIAKLIEKGKWTKEQKDTFFSEIIWTDKLEDLKDCELIIEAIVENLEVKKELFSKLENIVSTTCILSSNTSSLSLTAIASTCKYPERFIGIHFFNPAPLMKLVEIIPALQTSEGVLNQSKAIINSLDKIPVVAKDTPGFIVNKVARPYYSESIKMYEEGFASIEEIDYCLTQSNPGFRMGPFALMDLIGHDVNYKVTETVWQSFYFDPRYKPAFSQKRLVEAGWLGKKSNRGFYNYANENSCNIEIDEIKKNKIVNRVLAMLINEAADTLYLNIASKEDIDKAMQYGVNYPKGLLQWADEIGISNVVKSLEDLMEEFGDDRYRVCPLLKKMKQENKNFY